MATRSKASKLPAVLTLGLLIVSLIVVPLKLSGGSAFESNILSLLPSNAASTLKVEADRSLQQLSERRVTVLASSDNPGVAKGFLNGLEQEWQANDLLAPGAGASTVNALRDWYKPYRYQLLNAEQRHFYTQATTADIAEKTLRELYSPFSAARAYPLAIDPFGVSGGWFAGLRGSDSISDESPASVEYKGRRWLVLNLSLAHSPFDMDQQRSTLDVLQRLLAENTVSDLQVLTSGMLFHAAAGAALARSEVQTLGLLSLIAITALVLAAFRSLRILFAIGFLLSGSMLAALAACLIFFDKVNLITLAFGTSLLGIAVDYAFHYFCLFRAGVERFAAASRIRSGVLLSMFSTVLAYTMQFGSPFPGLHQFAVFIIAGIVTAGLMVIYLIPYVLGGSVAITNDSAKSEQFFNGVVLALIKKCASRPGLLAMGLVLVFGLSVTNVLHQGANDDIRNLNTSSDALMDMESRVTAILARSGGQQYFILQGSPEQRLQQAEELSRKLNLNAKNSGLSERATPQALSVARFVPSQVQQRADYELLMSRLFSDNGVADALCKLDANLCALVSQKPAFDDSLTTASIPPVIAGESGLERFSNSDFDLLLPAQQLSAAGFKQVLEGVDQVEGVDRASELSTQLGLLRAQVSWLVTGFLVCLSLIAVYVFAHLGLVVLIPLLLSVLLALSLAPVAGVTLFHLLAVLLVMGLTIDAAIFYLKLGFNHDVWLAVSLSSLTSMCAFGLLSYSAVPVLAQFGSVVFVGLLSAWILIPLVFCMLNKKTDL